jgi:hypothetical protein
MKGFTPMKYKVLAFALLAFGFAIALKPASADGILKNHHNKPYCEPGYQLVEEVVIQEVTRAVCKMVPETKKKWVYSTIDAPYCVLDSHGNHHCPQCAGPYCRKLLVKRQIDEPCETLKCVTELIVEKVPVTIYRKVPCATDAPKAELIPRPLPQVNPNKK